MRSPLSHSEWVLGAVWPLGGSPRTRDRRRMRYHEAALSNWSRFRPFPKFRTQIMATIVFYEKPGCINNTRQKALLEAAGHQVEARNLLIADWTPERLEPFFADRPISEWFNRSNPAIKSGEIDPEQLDRQTALQLMVQNPLLIRRPLMQVGERCEVGFEMDAVDAWVGLNPLGDRDPKTYEQLKQQDLQTCPRTLNRD